MLRRLIPRALVDYRRRAVTDRIDAQYANHSPEEIFGDIYRKNLWGGGATDYNSGTGSHQETVVAPYVNALRTFLTDLPDKPDVVDLGCGDFNVGSRLRDACAGYVACDVVAELIERNARRFASLNVTFRQLDIVADELPAGDIVFLRQVLQHLSNDQIARITPKLYRYRWLVLTEHLPARATFVPNHDKAAGPGVRLRFGSGVVLTAAPFNLQTVERRELCSVMDGSDVVETLAYRLSG